MKLTLALICIGGCALYAWLIFSHPPVENERGADTSANAQANGHSLMRQDQQLEHIAAKIDDISETLEEIKSTVGEGGTPSSRKLDEVQAEVKRAADAIDKHVDPE